MLFGLISPTALADCVVYIESTGSLAPVIFSLAFTLAIVACLPSSIFEIVAGFLFPLPVAVAANMVAKCAGALAAFVLGRTACKSFVQRKAEKIQLVRAMRHALRTHPNSFKLALLLRLSPAPIFVKNYGLGALEMTTANFLGSTFLSGVPFAILWAMMGAAARDAGDELMDLVGEDKGSSAMDQLPSTTKTVLLVVGAVLMVVFGAYMKRTLGEIIEEEKTAAAAAASGGGGNGGGGDSTSGVGELRQQQRVVGGHHDKSNHGDAPTAKAKAE